MRVLSIDWDYFVEEDPMLDYGHQENTFFLDMMWKIRSTRAKLVDGRIETSKVDFAQELPFRGSMGSIINLRCLQNDYKVGAAESHLAILQMIEGESNLEIANIDAHHDLGYKTHGKELVGELNCGNWGEYLIRENRVKSWMQIYPEWRTKYLEVSKKNSPLDWASRKLGRNNVKVSYSPPNKVLNWDKVDKVFVCRSGCWTPPIYDEKFNLFIRMLGSLSSLPLRSLEEEKTNA